MTLGTIIKNYRTTHSLSQRKFANLSGLTNGYISMLENGKNPKTNEPIIPTLSTLKQIAKAIGLSLNELLDLCDDIVVSIDTEEADEGINLYKKLDDIDKAEIKGTMKQMLKSTKYDKAGK